MIFSFMAKLGLDVADFQAGIKRAESSATGMAQRLKGSIGNANKDLMANVAGFFTASAAKSYFSDLKGLVDEIKDMSELLGVSTDEVQRLQKASSLAGQSFTDLVSGFRQIEQMRAKALTGDARAVGIFGMLGIDPSKGSGIDVLKSAIEASSKGARENAAAMELIGGKTIKLKLTVEELQRLGPIKLIDEAQLDAIDAAIKKQEEALRQLKIAGAPIASTFAQGATGLLNMFNPNVETVSAADVGLLKAIETNASRFLGMQDDDGRKYSALPLPERRQAAPQEDSTAIVMRIAQSRERPAQILADQTGR